MRPRARGKLRSQALTTPPSLRYVGDNETGVELGELPAHGVHPNDNTATVWMSFKDLKKLIEKLGNPISYIKV